jgi:hypothetical protein
MKDEENVRSVTNIIKRMSIGRTVLSSLSKRTFKNQTKMEFFSSIFGSSKPAGPPVVGAGKNDHNLFTNASPQYTTYSNHCQLHFAEVIIPFH